MDIWRSLKLVQGQSLLFFLSTLIAFVLILLAPSLAAKKILVYKSSAKVLITPTSATATATGGSASPVKTWFADEATLMTLLSSQDLLEVVIDSCNMKMPWTELRDRIRLEVLSSNGNQVSLLEISSIGEKPEETRLLALTLSEKFIQYVQQLSAAEQDKTVAFLERERRNTETEMARAQKRLLKIGILPRMAGQQDPIEEAWVQLQTRRSELERDVALAQVDIEQLEVSGEIGVEGGAASGVMSETVKKEQLALLDLREKFQDRSPQVQAQLAKVARMQALENSEVRRLTDTKIEAARRKYEKVAHLLADTEKRLKDLEARRPSPEKHLEYANQERQLAMWQENYLNLTRQLYNARVVQQSSRREGAFTIVEKPQPGRLVAGQAASNSMATRVLMAIPLALICGLGAVMAFDYLTASMQLQPRIEEALGLPVIGSIPAMPMNLVSDWDEMKGMVGKARTPAP